MKMNIHYITFLVFLATTVVGTSLLAQAKEDPHKSERLQADAYAFAYLKCQENYTVHHWKQNPDNRDLTIDARAYSLTLNKMRSNFEIKYHEDSATFNKFEKEMNFATKRLNVCLKYQKILDAEAISEGTKKE